MPLAGEQLTIKEALAICSVFGFKDKELVTAVAVMWAESGRYTEAWHDNLDADGSVSSVDRGLFQINSKHQMSGDPFDPKRNVSYAFQLSEQGKDWTPWVAYNSGAHRKFLDAVREVKQDGAWESRKKLYE